MMDQGSAQLTMLGAECGVDVQFFCDVELWADKLGTTPEHLLAVRGLLPVTVEGFEDALEQWRRAPEGSPGKLALYQHIIVVATTEQLIELANGPSTAFGPGSIAFYELARRLGLAS